jgi:hypothetical protein
MEKTNKERHFSIELKTKANLKNITLTNGGHENVLIVGSIGKLERAEFTEEVILEVAGEAGVLRINLLPEEITIKSKEASGNA